MWILAETVVPVMTVHKSTLTAVTEVSSPSLLSSYVVSETSSEWFFWWILTSSMLEAFCPDVGVTYDSVVKTSLIGFLRSIFCQTASSVHHFVRGLFNKQAVLGIDGISLFPIYNYLAFKVASSEMEFLIVSTLFLAVVEPLTYILSRTVRFVVLHDENTELEVETIRSWVTWSWLSCQV